MALSRSTTWSATLGGDMKGLSRLTTLIVVIEGLALGAPEIATASSDRSSKAWQVMGRTNPGNASELLAVTAISSRDLWAVGWFAGANTDLTRPPRARGG